MDFRQQCVDLLRSESEWPLPNLPFESLTYQFSKSEISFVRNEAIKIKGIYRLRSIPQLDKTVYIVDLGSHNLHLFAIRRIAMAFTTSSRKYYTRKKESVENLIFIVIHSNGLLSVVHCQGENALSATMAVSGKEPDNHCPLFLAATQFSHLIREHWSLPSHLYVRYKRTRDPIKCIEEAVDEHAPELMRLFIRAKRAPALTQSEEDILFYQLRDGSEKAKEKLITCHLIVAFEQAYRFYRRYEESNVSFEDAFYGALDGLLISLDRYAPEQGNRFRSFAWLWVFNKAERACSENHFPISFPYYIWERASKFSRAIPLIEYKLSATPSHQSLDSAISEHVFSSIKRSYQKNNIFDYLNFELFVNATKLLTLQQPNLEPIEFFENLADENKIDWVQNYAIEFYLEKIQAALKPREWKILQYRIGIHPQYYGQELTLQTTGELLNVTRERVRQIELRAYKRLAKAFEHGADMNSDSLISHSFQTTISSSNDNLSLSKQNNVSLKTKTDSTHQTTSPNTQTYDVKKKLYFDAHNFTKFEPRFLANCTKQISRIDYKNLYWFLIRMRNDYNAGNNVTLQVNQLLDAARVKNRGFHIVQEIEFILDSFSAQTVPHFKSVGMYDSIELVFTNS